MPVSNLARRRTAAGACALATTLVLSACGSDSAGSSSTAAQVGAERVSRSRVLGAVDRALAGNTELPRGKLTEEHLTTQIKLALYRAQAKRLGVTLTDDERKITRATFEEQTAAQGGLDKAAETSGISKQDLPDVVDLVTYETVLGKKLIQDAPITDAELESLRATNPDLPKFEDQLTAAHILVKEESLAKSLLAEIKAGGDFAALAAKNSLDPGSKVNGGELPGALPAAKGTYVPEFEEALNKAKPGEVVGPVKTQFGFHLITVKQTSGAEIRDKVRAQAGPIVARNRLKALVSEPEVKVNSRFGRWDPETLTIVGPDGAADKDDPSAPSSSPAGPGEGDVDPGPPGGGSEGAPVPEVDESAPATDGSAPAPSPSQ